MKLLFFRGLVNIFRFIPTFFLELIILLVSPIYRILFPNNYRIFLQNMSFIYPEKSDREIKRIARRSVRTSIENSLFSLKLMKRKKLIDKFEFRTTGIHQIEKALEKNAAILIVPHLGINFLPILALAKKFNKKIVIPIRGNNRKSVVVRKTYQYLSNDLVKMPFLGGTMSLIEGVIKDKGLVVLALDAILPVKHKKEVNFFGSKFQMTSGPLWLSKKYSLPIFSVCSVLENQRQMKIQVEKISFVDKTEARKMNIIAKKIETYIKKNPGSWNLADDFFALQTI